MTASLAEVPGQLDLFTGTERTVDRPIHADTVCVGCGATWRLPVDGGPGGDWHSAASFGYVELKRHQADGCPGDTEVARAARLRLLSVWPVHEDVAPGSVRNADLVTSTWDARAALHLALGHELSEGQA